MMGGVKTSIWGETNIGRLFAVGEVACTGVHGANRLASNSMLEVLVFSKRVIDRTRKRQRKALSVSGNRSKIQCSLKDRKVSGTLPTPSISALQILMWDKVGIIRKKEGLMEAADTLAGWQKCLPETSDRHSYELSNLVMTGRLVTEAALMREESRGAHFRSDFPASDSKWQHSIVFTKNQEIG